MSIEFNFSQLKAAERLPSPSGTAYTIMQLLKKDNTTVQQLANTAKSDPALTSRILSFANSAAFGARRPIADVTEAVRMMGMQAVRNFALSLSLVAIIVKAAALTSIMARIVIDVTERRRLHTVMYCWTRRCCLAPGHLLKRQAVLDPTASHGRLDLRALRTTQPLRRPDGNAGARSSDPVIDAADSSEGPHGGGGAAAAVMVGTIFFLDRAAACSRLPPSLATPTL